MDYCNYYVFGSADISFIMNGIMYGFPGFGSENRTFSEYICQIIGVYTRGA